MRLVLESLLERYPAAVQVDDLSDRLPVLAVGLDAYAGQTFQAPVRNAARLWPISTTPPGSSRPVSPRPRWWQPRPSRRRTSWSECGLERLAEPEAKRLMAFFDETYGFALDAWLAGQDKC